MGLELFAVFCELLQVNKLIMISRNFFLNKHLSLKFFKIRNKATTNHS